ncbi:aminotransferase class III-fold pyridoxal phosphate-dependent enzyme [uncultured Jannaschia sp.]|uniref:aminotransferase class III-fold pyridoxal phosphate-dependent enzyme n=1 Tax=uncultured Jannaschia sp. TaxID=293347 RepID=UPI0026264A2B|nr:aminotransferase class III-fold pyridoxal phosphate-dependent enzyme [uncultured Jannaschia sp.]
MTALNPARKNLLQMFALDARMVRGSGFRLFDEQGREYLDFLSQYGALPFGHNPSEIWTALNAAQAEALPSMVQPLRPVEAERLAERLAEVTPGDLSITTLTNSGAETVEAAIKLARLKSGKTGILSTGNGFHGKTLGALSATGKPMYQEGFAAPAPGFDHIPYGDLNALRDRLSVAADGIAAFIFEPIQGEGGVICPPEGYVDGAIALCREYGVLTILDEIQTGMGRTGRLFACSDGAEVPDMLLLSKALGGGMMPIGALVVRPSAWDDDFGRRHSSTFANNNLASRAAMATLDRLLADDQALIRDVAENGAYLHGRLEDLRNKYPEVIREVRGRGYMLGLEFQRFDKRADSAIMAFASLNGGVMPLISSYLLNVEGVLTAPLFNETHVMRLQPTLTSGRVEIDRAVAALNAVCDVLAARDYYRLVRHLVAKPVPACSDLPDAEARPAVTPPMPDQEGRFTFLIHYTEPEDIFRSDPSFRQFSADELANWCNWVKQFGPGFVRRMPEVTSKTGATAEGWLMSVPMLPQDMRGGGRSVAASMIKGGVDLAAKNGASRVGLGAFTSIVTRGGETATGRGVPITSGNTLTAVSAVKGIERVASRAGLSLEDAHVVVVGASGAIGRLASLMLGRRIGRLSLVGNAANPFTPRLLSRVADEVYGTLLDPPEITKHRPGNLRTVVRGIARQAKFGLQGERKGLAERFGTAFQSQGTRPLVDWSTPLEVAVADADIVLVATSSEMALIDPLDLRPGTLVCDIARPPNVAPAEIPSARVLVFDGGLIQPPFEVDLGPFQTLPANLCWGCLGETMLLALAREKRDYSIGSRLSLADADHLAELADQHGFEPAPPQWYGRHVAEGELAAFAGHVAATRIDRPGASERAGTIGKRA